ncbi:hypothetical protein K440DRAFT_247739 [Wilcoxina mikolae CBS 423.85]|nr:hypothetical protein K440DRAFT_247739 [Wilcoxina mikolae CBS 423.85]
MHNSSQVTPKNCCLRRSNLTDEPDRLSSSHQETAITFRFVPFVRLTLQQTLIPVHNLDFRGGRARDNMPLRISASFHSASELYGSDQLLGLPPSTAVCGLTHTAQSIRSIARVGVTFRAMRVAVSTMTSPGLQEQPKPPIVMLSNQHICWGISERLFAVSQ